MVRAKWPSQAITKEALPSFLLGHANQSSRESSIISHPEMPMQRETDREEMNSELCNVGGYNLKAKLWLLDKQGSRTYVKARKQERQWRLQKLVLGERRNNARQGKTVSNWVVVYKLINSGLLSFHPILRCLWKRPVMAGAPSVPLGEQTCRRHIPAPQMAWALLLAPAHEVPTANQQHESPVQLGNKDESEGCRVVLAMRVKIISMWCVFWGRVGCLCLNIYMHVYMHINVSCIIWEWSMFNPRD